MDGCTNNLLPQFEKREGSIAICFEASLSYWSRSTRLGLGLISMGGVEKRERERERRCLILRITKCKCKWANDDWRKRKQKQKDNMICSDDPHKIEFDQSQSRKVN
eukprot:scaffold13899_cov88-Skeletonema_marinoi.AAC.1